MLRRNEEGCHIRSGRCAASLKLINQSEHRAIAAGLEGNRCLKIVRIEPIPGCHGVVRRRGTIRVHMSSSTSTPTPTKQRTVLVVDDFPSVRYYHTHILKKAGYACQVAHDGQEALQRLKEGPVDLVVIDIMMPNMSGLEFMEQIRGTFAYAHLPVLVISSEPVGHTVRRNRTPNSGAVGFAQKPLFAEKVIAEVHRLLADA